MKITVNGKTTELEKSVNIAELLIIVKAEQPDYVTVQRNDEFVDRVAFPTTFVEEGDNIEFLYFMGGGK